MGKDWKVAQVHGITSGYLEIGLKATLVAKNLDEVISEGAFGELSGYGEEIGQLSNAYQDFRADNCFTQLKSEFGILLLAPQLYCR